MQHRSRVTIKKSRLSTAFAVLIDTNSVLYRMCQNSGEYNSLLELAKAEHQLEDVSYSARSK